MSTMDANACIRLPMVLTYNSVHRLIMAYEQVLTEKFRLVFQLVRSLQKVLVSCLEPNIYELNTTWTGQTTKWVLRTESHNHGLIDGIEENLRHRLFYYICASLSK